jgi:hypothetical protein
MGIFRAKKQRVTAINPQIVSTPQRCPLTTKVGDALNRWFIEKREQA